MHSFRSTPQDIACSHESKSGDRNTGLRGMKPTWDDQNLEKSSTRTDPKTERQAQKRRKRLAWDAKHIFG